MEDVDGPIPVAAEDVTGVYGAAGRIPDSDMGRGLLPDSGHPLYCILAVPV